MFQQNSLLSDANSDTATLSAYHADATLLGLPKPERSKDDWRKLEREFVQQYDGQRLTLWLFQLMRPDGSQPSMFFFRALGVEPVAKTEPGFLNRLLGQKIDCAVYERLMNENLPKREVVVNKPAPPKAAKVAPNEVPATCPGCGHQARRGKTMCRTCAKKAELPK